MSNLINNFYILRIVFIVLLVVIGIGVIDNLKTKDKINIKDRISFKNINNKFLFRMLFLSFFLRILIEQISLLINVNQAPVFGTTNWLEIIVEFISTCVFASVFEEIIIRFGLYEKLSKKLNFGIAIIISSIIFAILHLYNFYGFIILFVISIVWNYSYYKTNNLIYPIILHFVHNIYALLSNYILNNNFYIMLGIISFILYIILFLSSKREK